MIRRRTQEPEISRGIVAKQPHGLCGCHLCRDWVVRYVLLPDGHVTMLAELISSKGKAIEADVCE